MGALKGYAPRDNKNVEAKNKLLNNVANFYKGREKIIQGFKNGVFPPYYNEAYEYQIKGQKEIEEERRRKKEEEDEKKIDLNKLNKWITKEETEMNKELFKKHFFFQTPPASLKNLNKTNDKEKNNELVEVIISGLKDLKKEIKKMSKKEIKIKNPEPIVFSLSFKNYN